MQQLTSLLVPLTSLVLQFSPISLCLSPQRPLSPSSGLNPHHRPCRSSSEAECGDNTGKLQNYTLLRPTYANDW